MADPDEQPVATEPEPDRVSSTDDYANRFRGRAGAYLLGVQTRGLLELIEPMGTGLRILDVGGGHAQSAVPLARAGHKVTILSSRPEFEARARRECEGLGVEFRTGPLDAPPVEPGAYDVVVALRMVMHMPDWRAFIAGVSRIAGRAVLVDYPSWRSSNALEPLLFELKRRIEGGGTRRYGMYWPRSIHEAFAHNGFGALRSWPQCALPLVVHRALNAPAVTGTAENVLRRLGATRLLGSPVLVLARRDSTHERTHGGRSG